MALVVAHVPCSLDLWLGSSSFELLYQFSEEYGFILFCGFYIVIVAVLHFCYFFFCKPLWAEKRNTLNKSMQNISFEFKPFHM